MRDDFISQEEIDALLKGGIDNNDSVSANTSSNSDGVERLSDIERDALGEIGNISMGSAATTLSVLLGHRVSITTPQVSIDTLASIKDHYPMPYLIVEVGYTHGIEGNNILAIQAQDALIIADLMMGGDGTAPPEELNELHMSAVGEAMNQMMGAVSTSLSMMFNKKIDISPPKINLIDLAKEDKVTEIVGSEEKVVRVSFRMEVEGLIDSEIMQILPIDISKDMVNNLMSGSMEEAEPQAPVTAPPVMQQPAPQQVPVQETYTAPPQQPAQQQTYAVAPMQQARVASNIPVQPAQFSPLSTEPVTINDANIGLILDVPLQVTVELGRTKKRIRDILELANGSIIELDKLAGEPVDILVNGKLLAKGEVVVIDENFGVRITDIVSPMERAQNLQ